MLKLTYSVCMLLPAPALASSLPFVGDFTLSILAWTLNIYKVQWVQAILIGSSVFQNFSKLVLNAVKLMMNQQAKIDCRDSIS